MRGRSETRLIGSLFREERGKERRKTRLVGVWEGRRKRGGRRQEREKS